MFVRRSLALICVFIVYIIKVDVDGGLSSMTGSDVLGQDGFN